MDIAIMLEGQMGLTWERLERIATAVEDLGFAGLYRSDHFSDPSGPYDDSLELLVSLTWLASHTSRIDFGALVSPLSFRHPVWLARMGYQIDDLSNGRHSIGIGAGWQEREHNAFGFELGSIKERSDRLEEGAELMRRLIHEDDKISFEGEYYTLNEAKLMPRPQRKTPLLIGGNGQKRTLPTTAKYADEWNGVFLNAEAYKEHNELLTELIKEAGRDPSEVRRSMMTGLSFHTTEESLKEKFNDDRFNELRKRGLIIGTASMVKDQLDELADITQMDRVMVQWVDYDNVDGLEAFAKAVL